MLASALDLASQGLRVFPCRPGLKVPHGKLAPNGCKDATTDRDTIARWWSQCPTANIGVATGDGLTVVGFDPYLDGARPPDEIEAEVGKLPETWAAHTPRGGLHVYLQTNGTAIRNAVTLLQSFDVRGAGGYVLAPPSRTGDGEYRWETEPGICDLAHITQPWQQLLEDRSGGKYVAPAQPTKPGQRNSETIRYVGAMRHYGLGGATLQAVAHAYNAKANSPPLPDHEIDSMCRTAERWDQGTPAVIITRALAHGATGPDSDTGPMPWETVSDTDIVRIIYSHRLLAPIAKAFGAGAKPSLPASVTVPRALVMAGCAMAQPVPGWSNMTGKSGVELARLRIETGGGQTTNMWHLLVAPSGTGKDIGNVADRLASSEAWLIAGGGSAEGLAEGMTETPAGLIVVGEFENWLDRNHWQSAARPFVTEAWQKGQFKTRLAKGRVRESHYCYPSMMANVQPEILAARATYEHLTSGFMPRFMVSYMPQGQIHRPRTGNLERWHAEAFSALACFKEQVGAVHVPEDYLHSLYVDTFAGLEAPYRSHWQRLVNEYGPKIATVLAVDGDTTTPVIQDRHWDDTSTILLWLYRQAADAFDGIAQPGETAAVNQRYAILLRHFQDEFAKTKKPVPATGPIRFRRPRMPSQERETVLAMLIQSGDLVPRDGGFVPRRTV